MRICDRISLGKNHERPLGEFGGVLTIEMLLLGTDHLLSGCLADRLCESLSCDGVASSQQPIADGLPRHGQLLQFFFLENFERENPSRHDNTEKDGPFFREVTLKRKVIDPASDVDSIINTVNASTQKQWE